MAEDACPAISIRDVAKSYRLTGHRATEIKTTLLHPRQTTRGQDERFFALKGVSFDVLPGDSLGIIGSNGSGKSTLLRVMAGLTTPSSGSVTVNGRMATLLELGAGFHGQISGRDNAILNAVLLGLTMKEARERVEDVIEFAELRQFIDQPMRTYSQGMFLRLGFAVAVHVRPEVLLVDEVLAVGDADFQQKCYAHIDELRTRGVTIVIVSHDLPAVERFTDRAILLEKGLIAADGPPRDVIERYRRQSAVAG